MNGYNLNLSPVYIQTIVDILAQAPFRAVAPIIGEIERQVSAQNSGAPTNGTNSRTEPDISQQSA